jgi:adenosylhomocysteine nucleosidase
LTIAPTGAILLATLALLKPGISVILIFYAFAREVRAFKRRLKGRAPLGIAGLKGFRAWLGPTQVIAVATGIGTRRAAQAAERALDTIASPALVIATGVAGALSADLRVGDIVLADRIIADSDSPPHGSAAIAIPGADLIHFAAALNRHGIKFATGPILTVSRVLEDAAAKRDAATASGALAVDMESAAVAAAAHRRGLRFACVRTVLDTLDEEVVGAGLAGPEGEVSPAAAAGFVLRHPAAVLRLAGMLRSMNRAAAALAGALEALAAA